MYGYIYLKQRWNINMCVKKLIIKSRVKKKLELKKNMN